jgi:hypothetical protein
MGDGLLAGGYENTALMAENRHSYHIFVAIRTHVATMPSALRKKQ